MLLLGAMIMPFLIQCRPASLLRPEKATSGLISAGQEITNSGLAYNKILTLAGPSFFGLAGWATIVFCVALELVN